MKLLSNVKNSIKGKLIVISLLLIVVPLLVLGMISYQESSSSLDELGATNLKNGVELTIELINNLHEEVENGHLSLEEAQEKVRVSILGEKTEEGTRPINQNLHFGESGYIFILDQEANQVAHPYTEGSNVWDAEDENGVKFAQEMIKIGNNGGGFIYYDWPLPEDENTIAPKVTYSKTDPHWGWVINGSTYMKDFNQPANKILNVILITIIISLIVGVFTIWIFVNRITKPIRFVTDRMNQLANRNLSLDPLKIKSKDETGILADSINHLQSGLRNILESVSNTSDIVASNSEELAQSANEVMTGTEQVSATMQELASGTESQANSASNLASDMNTFTVKVMEANEDGKIIEENAKNVLQLTEKGGQLMENSVQQMEKINHVVEDVVAKMERLDQQSKEISNLVTVINDIADQTNLLALNASIEAARAGEHGKGFAVVANEVGKLAEQVADSVSEITDHVNGIQEDSKIVAQSLIDSYGEVERGRSQIELTGKSFQTIQQDINEVVDYITNVSRNLAEITENTGKVNQSIEEIASISEESAAGVEQTSASVQQTSSAMEEIAGSSEQLANTAEKLNELVQRFKL